MKKSLLVLLLLFLASCVNNKSSLSSSKVQDSSDKVSISMISSSIESSDNSNVSLEKEKLYEIYGRVIDTENKGISNIKIKLTSIDYENEVLTSNSGGYHFNKLQPGVYKISMILEDNYKMESAREILTISLSGRNYFYQNSDIILKKENIIWGELS